MQEASELLWLQTPLSPHDPGYAVCCRAVGQADAADATGAPQHGSILPSIPEPSLSSHLALNLSSAFLFPQRSYLHTLLPSRCAALGRESCQGIAHVCRSRGLSAELPYPCFIVPQFLEAHMRESQALTLRSSDEGYTVGAKYYYSLLLFL